MSANEIRRNSEVEVEGELTVFSQESVGWSSSALKAQVLVKDEQFSEVAKGITGKPIPLPPGLYSVEAFGPSGIRLSRLVRVEAGKLIELTLDEPKPSRTSNDSSIKSTRTTVRQQSRNSYDPSAGDAQPFSGSSADFFPHALELGVSPRLDVKIFAVTPSIDIEPKNGGWRLTPGIGRLHEVPVVSVRRGDHVWEVSLPVNPEGRSLTSACTLDLVDLPVESRATPFVVGFPPERGVAHFIGGQIKYNTFMADTGALEEATTLLRSKYNDPPAAALGGLMLSRLGLLLERADWVENLAKDFPWLTDARILQAAVLRDDGQRGDRDRCLDILLEAAAERPLYADGLSLALELLQRWPGRARSSERAAAIERLGTLAAYADWSSVSLVTRVR